MKIQIYRNGKEDSCVIYVGETPSFIRNSGNWEGIYPSGFEIDGTLKEIARQIGNRLECLNIKPSHYDNNSNVRRIGIGLPINAEKLSQIVIETFKKSL